MYFQNTASELKRNVSMIIPFLYAIKKSGSWQHDNLMGVIKLMGKHKVEFTIINIHLCCCVPIHIEIRK